MRWVEIKSEIKCEYSIPFDRKTYAMEIPTLGCIVSTTTTTVFVPGACIKDGKLVAMDGFGNYAPPVKIDPPNDI